MIHFIDGHREDGFTGAGNYQGDPTKGQWGGKGPDQVGTAIAGDPNSEFFKEGGTSYSDVPGTSGADQDTARYRGLADAAANRAAPVSNYAPGNTYAAQGLAARANQGDALSMIHDRATGGGPSAATIGMNQGVNNSLAAQLGNAAGASPNRAAGLAASGAATQGGVLGHGGAARAGEINGAQGALFGGFHDMRRADLTGMQMQDARTQHEANLVMGQHGLNQAQRMGFEGLGQGVRQEQLNNNIAWQAADQRRRTQQGNLDVQSRANEDKVADGVIGGVSSAASGGMTAYAKS